MDVSIIIVNYNTSELTMNCISSILSNTRDIEYEIIVVDNNSSDDSENKILSKFPFIKFIKNNRNLGFGMANNIGSKLAIGKFLFLLNSDTIVENNALKIFFDFYNNYSNSKNIGALGCILQDINHNPIHSFGFFPKKLNNLSDVALSYLNKFTPWKQTNKEKKYLQQKISYFSVEYITGADLFISKDLYSVLNGFDEDFFLYYEETDLQFRLSKMGYDRFIINGPQILHLEGSSYKKNNLKKSTIFVRSLLTYHKKNSPKFQYIIFKWTYLLLRMPILLDYRYSFRDRLSYLNTIMIS